MTIIESIQNLPLVMAVLACVAIWTASGALVVFGNDAEEAPSRERRFILANCIVALIWSLFVFASHTAPSSGEPPVKACTNASENTPVSEVRAALGSPTRVVSEDDTRGFGAEAWVYEQSRCVVHVLDDRVESVEYAR
jgi:hypothetical protein